MNMWDSHYFGMHLLWWLVWVVFLVWVFILPFGVRGTKNQASDAVEILKQRYARGEISDEEYQKKLKILEKQTS